MFVDFLLVISSVFTGGVVNVVSTRKRNFVLAHYQSIEKFQSDHQKDRAKTRKSHLYQ